MHSKLAGFNPVKLELRKSVRFPNDELVDVTIVKRFPKLFDPPQKDPSNWCVHYSTVLKQLMLIDL